MCLAPDTPETPKMPPQYAQSRDPDGNVVRSTQGRRTTDRMRAASPTVLTSGSGVTTVAPTEKKTLLGQ